jgi:hypothetical protein
VIEWLLSDAAAVVTGAAIPAVAPSAE